MTIKEINACFKSLLKQVNNQLDSPLKVNLVLDHEGSYPRKRDFAKTDGHTIFLSPKILFCKKDRLEGLLRHELAHVLYMQHGNFDHTELETDNLAEIVFGSPIYYDKDDVQTISLGKRPRPYYLPQ